VLQAAQRLLGQQLQGCEMLSSPQVVRDFLRVKLGALEHEVFSVLVLDAQNRLIEYVEMFRGTVSQASVYPREVVKESLARNAAALVLVDVRVLDHLIVAGSDVLSFAERGLL
jgi:DNA repair protein RadC